MTDQDDDAPAERGPVASLSTLWRTLAPLVAPHRGALAGVVLALLLEAGLNALLPLGFKYLIDDALVARNGRALVWIVTLLAVAGLLVSVTSIAGDYLFARVGAAALGDLRERMFAQLDRLSPRFYSRAEAGDLLSRFSGDVAAVESAITTALPWGVTPALDVLISAAVLFALNAPLALGAMLIWPAAFLGPKLFAARAVRLGKTKREAEAAALSAVQERVALQAVARAFDLGEPTLGWFRNRNAHLRQTDLRLSFLNALFERSASVGTHLFDIAILAVGGMMVFAGHLTVGTFVAFEALFLSLTYSLTYVIQYAPTLIQGASGAVRIEELMSAPEEIADAPGAAPLPPFAGAVEFRHVSMSYDGQGTQLADIELTVPRGEFLACVGPSGAGKSTLLNLLLRFYDPTQGAVLVDGHDIRAVTQRSLRRQMAVVFQEPVLFNTTIRENIRLGDPQASDADVEAAAVAAGIDAHIRSLPQGYDTLTGERGVRLSGGQRQRITIARAVLRKAAILLLDEPTSSLDQETEREIMQTIHRVARGRTVVAVTHRLASIVGADRIVVLDAGRIVATGTHDALLRSSPLYRTMWAQRDALDATPVKSEPAATTL